MDFWNDRFFSLENTCGDLKSHPFYIIVSYEYFGDFGEYFLHFVIKKKIESIWNQNTNFLGSLFSKTFVFYVPYDCFYY